MLSERKALRRDKAKDKAPKEQLRFPLTVRVILTVKNRIATAVRGLNDLGAVLSSIPNYLFEVNVFDDSSNRISRREFARFCQTLIMPQVQFKYHGRSTRRAIQLRLRQLDAKSKTIVKSLIRFPGTYRWDHAGILNFAFLTMTLDSENDDIIVLIDDDIRLRDSLYCGHRFKVDGRRVICSMLEQAQRDHTQFSGCGYWGRRDVSINMHQPPAAIFKPNGNQFGHDEPWILDRQSNRRSAPKGEGPHGLSFGLLAFRARLLSVAPLIRSYNEDWIWLRLLGPRPENGCRIPGGVLHAPIEVPGYCDSSDDFVEEFEGHVLYNAVNRCLSNANSFESAVNLIDGDVMRKHLHAETKKLTRTQYSWWTQQVHRLGRSQANILLRRTPHILAKKLSVYHAQIQAWPRIIACLKATMTSKNKLRKVRQ